MEIFVCNLWSLTFSLKIILGRVRKCTFDHLRLCCMSLTIYPPPSVYSSDTFAVVSHGLHLHGPTGEFSCLGRGWGIQNFHMWQSCLIALQNALSETPAERAWPSCPLPIWWCGAASLVHWTESRWSRDFRCPCYRRRMWFTILWT